MKDIETNIAIDVTESGYIAYHTHFSDGHIVDHPEGIWKCFKYMHSFTVNALQINIFKELEVPIVKVNSKRKPGVGWLKFWFWKDWNNDKVYDISVETIDIKKITLLQLTNGNIYYVDEPAEVFRNAINSITK